MKSPLSLFTLSICFALMFSCGKTDSVEPTVDNALLKNDCKVETSEVVYKDQDLVNTDGFVKVEQFYSATGKYKETRAKMFMYGKNIGEWLELKAVSFNNASYLVAINNQYSVTLTEEIKEANWKFTLPDGTAIEICSNQFPKILTLDKVTQPVSGKTWKFDLDTSNNKADYVSFYNFLFPYGSTSTEGSLNGNNLTASFDSYTVNEAMKSAKFFSYKELTLTASAGKSFIKTVKGKKLKIVIENVTEAKFALF